MSQIQVLGSRREDKQQARSHTTVAARRSWLRWLAVPVIAALLASSEAPASADSWVFGPVYTTHMAFSGTLDPTWIGFTSPASADVSKNAQLRSGYPLSEVCLFRISTRPNYETIGAFFGGLNWVLASNIASYGDNVGHFPSSDSVDDTNRDGQVMQDYQITWPWGYVQGRSMTIEWISAMTYGPSCTNENYSVGHLLTS